MDHYYWIISLLFLLLYSYGLELNKKFFLIGLVQTAIGIGTLVLGALAPMDRTIECSHQSGKCTIIAKTFFNRIVSKEQFLLSEISNLTIGVRSSSTSTSYNLVAIVKGKKKEIPIWYKNSQLVTKQKRDLENFLKNENLPEYKQSTVPWRVQFLSFCIGSLGSGLFLILSAAWLDDLFERIGYAIEFFRVKLQQANIARKSNRED